jgi:inosine-uridine nucleoside N-ribohydrolase
VVVDNVDPDNLAAALAATNPLFGFDVVGVMVTGRPAHTDRSAGLEESSVLQSRIVRRDNTRRMRGFLQRASRRNVRVFEGLIAPRTLVPHGVHIDETTLDVRADHGSHTGVDGSFIDLYELLLSLEGPIHVIVGGPLTDLAALIEDPEIVSRLGIITAQLGMFGFGDVSVMGGGRRQFNAACDPEAVHTVLSDYPGPVYMVPTDITKDLAVGFDTPDDLAVHHIWAELVDVYREAYPRMMEPRGERIYLHDVAPVFLLAQLLGTGPEVYGPEPATIMCVPHAPEERGRWGEIDVEFGKSSLAERYVVTSQNPAVYRDQLVAVRNGMVVGQHYFIFIDGEGQEHQGRRGNGRYLDGLVITKVCAKCGASACGNHPWDWPRLPCTRDRVGDLVEGLDPAFSQDNNWAYRLIEGRWQAAADHEVPLGACCLTC